jgi:hypothetical protein
VIPLTSRKAVQNAADDFLALKICSYEVSARCWSINGDSMKHRPMFLKRYV